MEWISQNWVWLLFAVGMVAMHMFGHGGHGGHGRHDESGQPGPDNAKEPSKENPGHCH